MTWKTKISCFLTCINVKSSLTSDGQPVQACLETGMSIKFATSSFTPKTVLEAIRNKKNDDRILRTSQNSMPVLWIKDLRLKLMVKLSLFVSFVMMRRKSSGSEDISTFWPFASAASSTLSGVERVRKFSFGRFRSLNLRRSVGGRVLTNNKLSITRLKNDITVVEILSSCFAVL